MCLSLKYQEAKRQNQGGGKGEFHQNGELITYLSISLLKQEKCELTLFIQLVLKNYDGYQAYNQEASGSSMFLCCLDTIRYSRSSNVCEDITNDKAEQIVKN